MQRKTLGEADVQLVCSPWLKAAIFCVTATILCAVALTLVLGSNSLALANSDEAPAAAAEVYSGVITDSVCGARHTRYPNLDAVRCTRECVRTGGKYMLINGDKIYSLQGDFADLAQFAGQRARVTGTLQAETIKVSAINSPQQ